MGVNIALQNDLRRHLVDYLPAPSASNTALYQTTFRLFRRQPFIAHLDRYTRSLRKLARELRDTVCLNTA
jgi:hypothetical protein